MTIRFHLKLPIPISSNALYRNNSGRGKGRFKTRESTIWLKNANRCIAEYLKSHQDFCLENIKIRGLSLTQKGGRVSLTSLHRRHKDLIYEVGYVFHFADPRYKKPRDICNFEKILSDFLVECGLILDDSFIDKAMIRRGECRVDDPHVSVEIKVDNCEFF